MKYSASIYAGVGTWQRFFALSPIDNWSVARSMETNVNLRDLPCATAFEGVSLEVQHAGKFGGLVA